jgi:hypothetical protein
MLFAFAERGKLTYGFIERVNFVPTLVSTGIHC